MRRLSLFKFFHDRFDNNDGVINEQPNRNRERQKGQDIDCEAEEVKTKKGRHEGCRDRHGNNDGRSDFKEENKSHCNNEPNRDHHVMGHILD